MAPAERERYLDAVLSQIDSLLLSRSATRVFVRPADDSAPDGADDLTRWLDEQFQRAA